MVQYIDHTLFKVIEQFVPAKANLKTGLLIVIMTFLIGEFIAPKGQQLGLHPPQLS